MLAWGYRVEAVETDAVHRSQSSRTTSGIQGYSPSPVDLSNMTLDKEMTLAAEKLAENAHLIWAKKTLEDLTAKGTSSTDGVKCIGVSKYRAVSGGGMLITLVPWDILTDTEKQKNRFTAQEIIKFWQFHGFKVSP